MAGCGVLIGTAISAADLVVVVGAPGTEEFGRAFEAAADAWVEAGKRGEAKVTVIGRTEVTGRDLQELEESLRPMVEASAGPLWIVLLGHGTFDGRVAKFNLRGPDLSAETLSGWLDGCERQVAVINCSASSAPFLKKLSAAGRTIVTATKSGSEDSYARFGEFLARTIDSPEADLDRDGATSLLEGFLAAAKGVEEFYVREGRISTEEALIDDNGDGLGTPADWFRGVRAVKSAKDGAEPDGLRAHQFHLVPSEAERKLPDALREERNALEDELYALRARKETVEEAAYLIELERILTALAKLYQRAEGDAIEP